MSSGASSQQTILVVEPEILVRLVIAEYLRDCGFKVFEGVTAEDAVSVLKSDRVIDIVLCEIRLPGSMDGFALAQWIRRHRPAIDVLLTSGKVKAAEKAGQLCDDGPLEKPYHPQEALRRINLLLERRRSAKKP